MSLQAGVEAAEAWHTETLTDGGWGGGCSQWLVMRPQQQQPALPDGRQAWGRAEESSCSPPPGLLLAAADHPPPPPPPSASWASVQAERPGTFRPCLSRKSKAFSSAKKLLLSHRQWELFLKRLFNTSSYGKHKHLIPAFVKHALRRAPHPPPTVSSPPRGTLRDLYPSVVPQRAPRAELPGSVLSPPQASERGRVSWGFVGGVQEKIRRAIATREPREADRTGGCGGKSPARDTATVLFLEMLR